MTPDRRPNVLIIMSDQHNARVMGCAGDVAAHTPALDDLARHGVRFESAYCPFPLCGPSRMSFMTARLPSRIDCLDNASQLSSDMPTFAHAFSAAGYETVLAGRMHFVGPDQRHGFQRRLLSDVTTAWVNRAWDLEPVLGDLIDTPGYTLQSVVKSGAGRTGYHAFDEAVTRSAVAWLAERGPADPPFLLVVGYVSPHSPYIAPPEHFDRCVGGVRQPIAADQPAQMLHPENRAQRAMVDGPAGASAGDRMRARAAYCGLASFLDSQVAAVVDALDRAGLRDDALIVYTSDHGDQIGEHGLWWKSTFYEGSVGVPLLMSGPGLQAGPIIRENVSLMDLGPTLLDLLDLPALPTTDARSFRCLLDGQPYLWPDVVLAEGLSISPNPCPMRMVRQGPWKLNRYAGHRPELFNIEQDPDEIADRHGDPACASILERLTAIALRDWDPEAVARRMAARTDELTMIRAHLERERPGEPDPLWFTEPQENWLR
ncbi:MAG: sulfatase [Armatimonadetes bacterium]|nr:sulfatase [Armatimonadota bacterium]